MGGSAGRPEEVKDGMGFHVHVSRRGRETKQVSGCQKYDGEAATSADSVALRKVRRSIVLAGLCTRSLENVKRLSKIGEMISWSPARPVSSQDYLHSQIYGSLS